MHLTWCADIHGGASASLNCIITRFVAWKISFSQVDGRGRLLVWKSTLSIGKQDWMSGQFPAI